MENILHGNQWENQMDFCLEKNKRTCLFYKRGKSIKVGYYLENFLIDGDNHQQLLNHHFSFFVQEILTAQSAQISIFFIKKIPPQDFIRNDFD